MTNSTILAKIHEVASAIPNCPINHVCFSYRVSEGEAMWSCDVSPYKIPHGRGNKTIRMSCFGLGYTVDEAAADVLAKAKKNHEVGIEGF